MESVAAISEEHHLLLVAAHEVGGLARRQLPCHPAEQRYITLANQRANGLFW
jgi:hypothetical protein